MIVEKELIALQKALFDFSKRNPFVHIQEKKLWNPADNDGLKLPEKIYKKANYYWKEYGLETTLDVEVFIKWSPPNEGGVTNKLYYCSPLFYRPVTLKRIRKIETTYSPEITVEKFQINPVLRHYFKLFFDYSWPEEIADLEEEMLRLQNYFSTSNDQGDYHAAQISAVEDFDETENWQLITRRLIGNFNYKKSALGADYDKIIAQPNSQVSVLLQGEVDTEPKETDALQAISFLDQSQKAVIQTALAGNMVIQGPPGTGKSHTIVALIGAFLAADKKVLFVSEKRSALEVVNNRLTKIGLGALVAYFNTNKDQKKAFYSGLKKTWETLNEHKFNRVEQNRQSEVNNILQFYPKKLAQNKTEINGCLQDLITVLLEASIPLAELTSNGKVPEFHEWKARQTLLKKMELNLPNAFGVQTIAQCSFVQLNLAVFSEPDVLLALEKRIGNMTETLALIQTIQTNFNLDESFDGFVKLALTASILNMIDKVQLDLLNVDSKQYKSFNSWAKKYQLLKTKISHVEKGNKKWSRKPSMAEITELLDLLHTSERHQSSSILKILRRNPAKLKTAFQDFHTGISIHTKVELLEAVQMEWRLKGELDEVRIKLRHNLNITDPENEIDLIFNLRNKLDAVSQNEYLQILEHQESAALIQRLSRIHPEILKFNSQNRFLFNENKIDSIHAFDAKLRELKTELPIMNHWLPEIKQYFEFPPVMRHFVQHNSFKTERLNAIIAYQNLLEITRFESDFKALSGWEIVNAVKRGIGNKKIQINENISAILDAAQIKQSEAEKLSTRAGFKLNDHQKTCKKRYKAQKRIVLHEINKQQRHLSVKGFFESTQEHLLKMQPVWVMNPLTVSENLPCIEDLFDVIIFDESSQIPLEDAVPAIYRSKQVIVVGDSKQMPPSAFFTTREDTKTILDQGEQVYANEMLKWHYRSHHPDLIRFSNLEFYNGDLLTLPPKFAECPIEVQYVEGNYDAGKNELEAEKVALYCKNIQSNEIESILIIAFSQEQEKEIRRQLKDLKLDIDDKIITRNLENAQGIEADLVLISLGYGKNENGEFRLNFGPVNQINGANRLNVMFTRAIEKMVVFTSVKASDFGLSENKGVQVLKDYLAFAEQLSTLKTPATVIPVAHQLIHDLLLKNQVEYSYYPAGKGIGLSSFIQHKNNRILLVDPGLSEGEVTDIESVLTVLAGQYDDFKVVLSMDLWLNAERVEADLIGFFKV
ncbi:MAG: Cdc6-like AAA superfamily ATPase [Crocinitomix sp.]|jgi:Cdc6-like AAA superfamily ATPase